MSKNKIPRVPTIIEATTMADILDGIGIHEDANLIDQFISESSKYSNDFVKQAGLWSWVWNKLSGNVKKLFFKEFRELHKEAKKLQELADKELDKKIKENKQAQKDLSQYQLVSWWNRTESNNVLSENQMSNFRTAYGKLMAYVLDLKDKKEKGEDLPEDANETEIGKVPELEKKDKITDDELFKSELDQEWEELNKRNPNTFQENPNGDIRISKELISKWKSHFRILNRDGNKILMPTNKGGKLPVLVKTHMGAGSAWEILDENDDRFVYLRNIGEEKKEEPQEKDTLETPEGKFKTPVAPEKVEPVSEEDIISEEPEEISVSEEDIVSEKPAKKQVSEETIAPEVYEKILEEETLEAPQKQAPSDLIWVQNKEDGNYEIINKMKFDPSKQTLVTDKRKITSLNLMLGKQSGGKEARTNRLKALIK